MTETLLKVIDLYCERDQRVLFSDLNFSLSSGDVLQVEGANGSGKTTLLRILTGLSVFFRGQVEWRGQPLQKVSADYREQTHYLGHLAGINSALTAEENLHWYAALMNFKADKEVAAALARVGLAGYEDVACYRLSAGQQRRVNLARLYLIPAKLWVLDEPFTAIDKEGVAAIEKLIQHQVEGGGAVVLTSHQSLKSIANLKSVSLN